MSVFPIRLEEMDKPVPDSTEFPAQDHVWHKVSAQ